MRNVVVGLLSLVLGACPSSEPSGPSDAGSTGVASTSGGSSSGVVDTGTTAMWPDPVASGGPPLPGQSIDCANYVACAAELMLSDADEIEQMYGFDAACWDSLEETSVCDAACEEELAAIIMELEGQGQPVPEVCDPPEAVAWAEIQAIFDASCITACHEPGGSDPSLDLSRGAYYAIYQVASEQSLLYLVEPGSHEDSYLWHKVNGSQGSVGGGGGRMPKGLDPLPPEQVDAIADWIDAGASNF